MCKAINLTPKVTIIMPSLNVGAYIREAIESARNQTLSDIEIICIDAGSDDGTREIIEEQARADDRITVIDSPVKSYGHQVDMAVDMARGEYVAILETDDYVASDMYSKLYEIAVKENLDYVKSDYDAYMTDSSGKRFFTRRQIAEERWAYEEVFEPIVNPLLVSDDSYLWNGIYRLSFLRDNNIRLSETSGAAFQDVGFLHKVKAYAKRVRYATDSYYRYCTDRDGASSNSGKSLVFLRQEYGLLIDESMNALSDLEYRLLYVRMARAYCRACMESDVGFLRSKAGEEICSWFSKQIKSAEQKGYVCQDDMPGSLRSTYQQIINSTEAYIKYRISRRDELIAYLNNAEQIIIFGSGIFGREANRYVSSLGKRTAYFMDNNSQLWGAFIDGVEVLSPERVSNLSPNSLYIIANERHSKEIEGQLRELQENVSIYIY